MSDLQDLQELLNKDKVLKIYEVINAGKLFLLELERIEVEAFANGATEEEVRDILSDWAMKPANL